MPRKRESQPQKPPSIPPPSDFMIKKEKLIDEIIKSETEIKKETKPKIEPHTFLDTIDLTTSSQDTAPASKHLARTIVVEEIEVIDSDAPNQDNMSDIDFTGTIPTIDLLSSSCSPPEMPNLSPVATPSRRVTRKSSRASASSQNSNKPLSELKKKVPKAKDKIELVKKKNEKEKEKKADPQQSSKKDVQEKKEKIEKESEAKPSSSVISAPIASQKQHLPKFNIVPGVKKVSGSSTRLIRRRSPSPMKPIQFKLVLDDAKVKAEAPRRRSRGRPRKEKPILKNVEVQVGNKTESKIIPSKDLCCKGCGKNYVTGEIDDDNQELETLTKILDFLNMHKQKQKASVMAIDYKFQAIRGSKEIEQPSQKEPLRICAPSHKVPTVAKPKKDEPPPLLPIEQNETNASPRDNLEVDTNTEPCDMEIEENHSSNDFTTTTMNNTNFSPFTRTTYGPNDIMTFNRRPPTLIPLGAMVNKPIVKKDDLMRLGPCQDLYANPLRPKLMDVEHPPEENTEALKSCLIVDGEVEPEIPDADAVLEEIFGNISDSEEEEVNGENEAKFSDDEDENEDNMSSACSVAMDNDENFDESSFPPPEMDVEEPELNMDVGDLLEEDLDTNNFGIDKNEKERPPVPEKFNSVAPAKRIEQEISKSFNQTPLEMVDEELDFDDDDDIQSPAYEPVTEEFTSEVAPKMVLKEGVLKQKGSDDSDDTVLDGELRVSPLNEDEDVSDLPIQNDPSIEAPSTTLICPTPDLSKPLTLSPFETFINNKDRVSFEHELHTATDVFLSDFYAFCKLKPLYFNDFFPIIAKELGTRKMTTELMESLRVCERPGYNLTHYKCIVDGLLLAEFDKRFVLEYIMKNHAANTKEANDLIIEIIFEKNGVTEVLDSLAQFVKQKQYSFDYTTLERLLNQGIGSTDEKWRNLVLDVLSEINQETRNEFDRNTALKEETLNWLRKGVDLKPKKPKKVEVKDLKKQSWFTRVIVNDKIK